MGGRKWTDEELVLLEELTEKYPLETVARRLNRTKEAVFLKRQRIGMGGYMANTDMLTRNTVSKILGIENRTLQYWERKGLKSYRKRPYVMYRQEDIIKYMREHPEDWNAGKIPIAPHLYFPRFMDDSIAGERYFGMEAGKRLMMQCKEFLVVTVDNVISEGMNEEIDYMTNKLMMQGKSINFTRLGLEQVILSRLER